MPTPNAGQGQGAAPAAGGAPPSTQQQPSTQGTEATGIQRLLANWYQVAKQMSSADPRLASGAEKVAQGIQEMQTALVTPPQHTPMAQQPQV